MPIRSFFGTNPCDCDDFIDGIARQPISTSIVSSAIRFYKSGVFSLKRCGFNQDVFAVATGYGRDETADKDYINLRLPWGAGWGESGYIRIDK